MNDSSSRTTQLLSTGTHAPIYTQTHTNIHNFLIDKSTGEQRAFLLPGPKVQWLGLADEEWELQSSHASSSVEEPTQVPLNPAPTRTHQTVYLLHSLSCLSGNVN